MAPNYGFSRSAPPKCLTIRWTKVVAEAYDINSLDELREWGYDPTTRQRSYINNLLNRKLNPLPFREALTAKFVQDKFGEATTHWRKLEDRVHRGVGNPCPLVLIGLPDIIVTFHEGKRALSEVETAETLSDQPPTE